MNKVFASPSRYIQGAGVFNACADYLKKLGNRVLLITDIIVWEKVGEKLYTHLTANGLVVTVDKFKGEASMSEINRITEIAKNETCDLIIGLGGGKASDTAKAVSNFTNTALAILPTIASTDAPTSSVSAVYSDEGVFENYLFYKKNPDLVLLDTEVISQAPVRLLKSGIADAMATWIEAKAVLQNNGENLVGGKQTLASVAIAEACEDVLFRYSLSAVAANEAQVVTKALEAIVEANTLLSGVGFESSGLGAAHSIHNGFTALTGEIHHLTHGEKVAYGTLTQLFLENRTSEEIDPYIRFYQSLGLPTTLEEMYLSDASYEDFLKVGELATASAETIHQMPFVITAKEVADALLAVDAYVKAYYQK
ncbi:glycerol dehydrogenase [Candidatus Enterococcus ferrettii]|uniref:Glycerol dehydrogenase n=1 Tax=Candidatus Enterococcus ferrettii TaxID=2815324 RepID=A0ABV0EUB8_9ENTE|nr:glycerol dehydrogenase [Enterococcus sp. 665A]MBO1339484.1 glycerol dehydrogenase [Enterococcus sp. 665A]